MLLPVLNFTQPRKVAKRYRTAVGTANSSGFS